MKKTFTPIKYFLQCSSLLVLLFIMNVNAQAQTKARRVEAGNGVLLHLTETNKFQETKRANGIGYYTAKVKFTIHHIEGKTQYRGFSLANHTPPKSFSFTFRAYNAQGTVYTQSTAYAKINAYKEYIYNISFKSSKPVQKIQTSSLRANYGSRGSTLSKKQLIDRYYQSITSLNNHLQALNYLHYDDPDQLKEAQNKLHDFKTTL